MTGTDCFNLRSPGDEVREGGAEQWEERGGWCDWGCCKRFRLLQLLGRDGWGPWQGDSDGDEDKDIEKDREGEGVCGAS